MSRMEQKQEKFNQWWLKKERLIIGLLIFMLALLIIIQAFYLNPEVRGYISTIEKMEGKSIDESQAYIGRGIIEIHANIESGENAPIIFINGVRGAEFDKNKAIISVMENDIIEINGIGINNKIQVEIINISENINTPVLGHRIEINNNIVLLGRVKLK